MLAAVKDHRPGALHHGGGVLEGQGPREAHHDPAVGQGLNHLVRTIYVIQFVVVIQFNSVWSLSNDASTEI